MKRGEQVECFNGDGVSYLYTVSEADKDGLFLELTGQFNNPNDVLPELRIFVSAIKGKNKDRIVRDLPPLGVTHIIFYHADRAVSRPEANQQARLQKIAIEACRQCRRSTVPEVAIPKQPLQDIVDCSVQTIIFWENENQSGLPNSLSQTPIQLIFGAEGGFSESEIAWAADSGLQFASLGPRILRSELAVNVGVVLVQDRRGLFASPRPDLHP